MKKIMKKVLIGALSIPLLAGGAFMFTACKAEVKSMGEVCDTATEIINSIESADEFTSSNDTMFYKKTGDLYTEVKIESFIPNYVKNNNLTFNDKINQKMVERDFDSSYAKLRLVYDATWAYSFNVIKDNIRVLDSVKDVKLNSSTKKSAENLKSSLESFNEVIGAQKRNRNEFVDYIYDLSTQGWNETLAQNAIYNYLKDYRWFVRRGLELAKVSTDVVDAFIGDTQSVEYKTEETTQTTKKRYTNKYFLQVYDLYYTFLAENTGSSNNNFATDFGNMCEGIMVDYIDFCGKVFDGIKNEANYTKTLEEIDVKTLEREKNQINIEQGNINGILSDFSVEYLNNFKNGDEDNFSLDEKTTMSYLSIYYQDMIKNWWIELTNKIFIA